MATGQRCSINGIPEFTSSYVENSCGNCELMENCIRGAKQAV